MFRGLCPGSDTNVLIFFEQMTAYGMRISDVSSDVCSSELSWGDVAVQHCMKFLSYSEPVLQKLEKFGFQRARLDHGRIDGINEPTTVVDFSGSSEERRVGNECVRTWRPRCLPDH